jgi:hypothetical protein
MMMSHPRRVTGVSDIQPYQLHCWQENDGPFARAAESGITPQDRNLQGFRQLVSFSL